MPSHSTTPLALTKVPLEVLMSETYIALLSGKRARAGDSALQIQHH
jgi:hypothetical protein